MITILEDIQKARENMIKENAKSKSIQDYIQSLIPRAIKEIEENPTATSLDIEFPMSEKTFAKSIYMVLKDRYPKRVQYYESRRKINSKSWFSKYEKIIIVTLYHGTNG